MTLRHAAALALVGWYLMIPPIKTDRHGLLDADWHAALSQWTTIQAYDTATGCKQDRAKFLLKAMEDIKPTDTSVAWETAWDHSQCIATDDPRLR